MPEIDLRDVVGDIREALQGRDREALIDMLTYLFKAYVVEGAAPAAGNALPTLGEELAGMRFGELISFLQQRVDLPELDLFEVHGERVLLRMHGSHIPIEVPSARPEPPPPIPPVTASAAPPAPRPTVSGTVLPTPPPTDAPAPATPATAPSGAAAARPSSPPAATPAPPRAPAKPADDTSDSAGRFHLLEID